MKKKKINCLFIVLCFLTTNNSLLATECPPAAIVYSARLIAVALVSAPFMHLIQTWSRQPLIYKACTPFLFTFAFYGAVETGKAFIKVSTTLTC
ncbi:MAG TPA: hypothetical protein VFF04_06885 [Candidatus Babeliales bacterium]|nr:hypothetical protein [Candidatus Babeliales bacterium]